MSEVIGWLSETNLKQNVEASRRNYDSIELEFIECLDYVKLDLDHFKVYSKKFNDIILKIGPEILTVFELILFNQKIARFFNEQPELKCRIVLHDIRPHQEVALRPSLLCKTLRGPSSSSDKLFSRHHA